MENDKIEYTYGSIPEGHGPVALMKKLGIEKSNNQMNDLLISLIKTDGFLFLLIGIIVLIIPSPQPGLTKKVNDEDLLPFSQTRRLLASMFIAAALLLIVIGYSIEEFDVLRRIAIVRIISFGLVIGLNANQYISKRWKPAPLIALMTIFSVMSIAYLYLIFIQGK